MEIKRAVHYVLDRLENSPKGAYIVQKAIDANMELSRRDALKLILGGTATLALAACQNTRTGYIPSTENAPTLPTSTSEPFGVTEYEFITQTEIEEKLAGPFDYFVNDENIKALFENADTITYTAGGIKVFDAFGNPTAYTFFNATSEKEKKSFVAMVFGGENGEVSYSVLNRVKSENNTVGLGLTYDPTTNSELLRPVLIFDTNLTEEQIKDLTPEELATINLIFIPGGIVVPNDKLYGIKNAVLAPIESPIPHEIEKTFSDSKVFRLEADGTVTVLPQEEGGEETKIEGFKINEDGTGTLVYNGKNKQYEGETFIIDAKTIKIDEENRQLSFTEPEDKGGMKWFWHPEFGMAPFINADLSTPELFHNVDFDYALSPEFDAYIMKLNKSGKFEEFPESAIPLETIVIRYTDKNDPAYKAEQAKGIVPIFKVPDDQEYLYNKPEDMPVKIASVFKSTFYDGSPMYIILEQWKDMSGQIKFRKSIQRDTSKYSGRLSLLTYINDYGYSTNKRISVGSYIKPTTNNVDYRKERAERAKYNDPLAFANWYTENIDLLVDEKIYEEWAETGILDNSQYIPVVYYGVSVIDKND